MDPGIKLFGKNIVLPGDSVECCGAVALQNITSHQEGSLMKPNTTCLEHKIVSTLQQRKQNYEEEEIENKDHLAEKQSDTTENLIKSKGSPESDGNPKTPSIGEEAATLKPPETENDQTDTNNSQQKTLKKPDKILPCPRCNSMDTKFCYYNNYNINQPRHFCKSCQRYWTAGGTMRNVPVGAGRRKNKNAASHFNHVTISEALESARIDAPNGIIHHPTFKTNGTILSFNSDPPLGEPMACVLNLEEKKSTRNGFYRLEEGIPVSCKGRENGDNCSSTSCVPTSNSMAEGGRSRLQGLAMPFYPWTYPWNSVVPIPPVCPSGIPAPFFPSPYWNCSVPGGWSIPWVSPSTPILGKRTRDGDLIKPSYFVGKEGVDQKDLERSILVPKTLRIDDPDEAAKSSIWETLGIKNDSIIKGGGFFKAFQTKGDEKSHVNTSSPVLQANPAAMSRSLTFQERA